jgi:iron complex outermembrane recepter protein
MLQRRFFLTAWTCIGVCTCTVAGAAVDQDSGSDQSPLTRLEEVLVTGTHIRGVEPAAPIIVIDEAAIESSGFQSLGDVIRTLPQSFGGGMNSTVVGATGTQNLNQYTGSSSANLRGLGSEATLTLVNGHRLAYSDDLSAVDISLIPLPAVDHIDVITDGASAIYGSDAVAGVVNVVLKRRYNGVNASATIGDSTEGGGLSQRYDLLGGGSWNTGNALVSYEYRHQDPVLAHQRSFVSPSVSQSTLLPNQKLNSIFAALDQAVGSRLDLFFQGLGTVRSSDQAIDFGPYTPGSVAYTDATVKQFGISAGGTADIGAGWHTTLAVDRARNSSRAPQNTLQDDVLSDLIDQNFVSGLTQVELGADGPLLHLPTGAVNVALGGSYRRETFAILQYDVLFGSSYADINTARHVQSAYVEADVPLVAPSDSRSGLESLALTLAGRYDRYSDIGHSSTPKIGLVYRPTADLELKASWNKSFRAPSLAQENYVDSAYLLASLDPGSPLILERFGGNPALQAETATSGAINVSYAPAWLEGFNGQATYYHISYRNRIEVPIQDAAPLSNPYDAPFVQRNPSAAELASIVANSQFFNYSGGNFDPATVAALVDDRYSNALKQHASGADLLLSYRQPTPVGAFTWSLNGAYLKLDQQPTASSPTQTLSSTIFNPPDFKARAGVTWERGELSATAHLNYVGGSKDPATSPEFKIDSWTTLDVQAAYVTDKSFWPSARLSVENLFDRHPPFTGPHSGSPPGFQFDSTNTSALGRFISLQVYKEFH